MLNQEVQDIRYCDINKICRTCLCEGNVYPLYEKCESQEMSFIDMLLSCTLTQFPKNESYPSQICSYCVEEITSAYKFAMKCEMSENILKKYLKDFEANDEPKNKKIINVDTETKKVGDLINESNLNVTNITVLTQNVNLINSDVVIPIVKEISPSQTLPPDHNYATNKDLKNHTIKNEKANNDKNIIKSESLLKRKIRERQKNIKYHTNPKCYECKKCSETFKTFKDLAEHRQTTQHHASTKKMCQICSKTVLAKTMKKHLRTHTNEKPFGCEVCGVRFTVRGNLQRHWYSRHSIVKPYNCTLCEKGFTSPSLLRNHMRIHTGERPFVCNFCGRSFAQSASFQKHLRTHTKTAPRSQTSSTHTAGVGLIYQCEYCSRCFDSKVKLKTHSIIHGEKNFLCQHCGRSFVSRALLQSHLKTHTGVRPYSCSVCQKAFSQLSALRMHKLIHSGQKPHCCSVCGKCFKQSTHLRYHLLTHSGEKPFSCEFCGKCFGLKGTLTVHKRIHTGETPFHCPVCNKGFYDSTTMKKHRRSHSETSVA